MPADREGSTAEEVELKAEQRVQEEQYTFPYHHVPRLTEHGFAPFFLAPSGYEYLAYLEFLIDKITELSPKRILDVGCGDGRLLTELCGRQIGSAWTGVDYSARAIAFAKAFCPAVDWHASELQKTELGTESFDLITTVEVIEHIIPDQLPEILGAIHKLLHKDGALLLSVPSDNHPVRPKHFQHFSKASLQEQLAPYFEIVEIHYLNRRRSSPFITMLRLLFGNGTLLMMNQRVLGWMFQYYRRHHLICGEQDCRRLAALCRPKSAEK